MDYRVWALLSAFFAAITAILAKKGVEGVPPNLALAARVVVVLLFAVAIAFATKQTNLEQLTAKNWTFLALSGIATGASWLCYFRALQMGPVSRVAPIDKLSFVLAMVLGIVILKEKVTPNLAAGAAMIVGGVLLTLK
jgi:bacterial/archaeal transporter family protein